MKNLETWLSISLLLMLVSNSVARAPAPPPDQPDNKAPSLLDAKPLEEDPKDDELRKLLKARYNAALLTVQSFQKLYLVGRCEYVALAEAEERLVQAGLELCQTPAERIALLVQLVEMTRKIEEIAKSKRDAARGTEAALQRARYQRLDAEIQLLRARREADKAKGK